MKRILFGVGLLAAGLAASLPAAEEVIAHAGEIPLELVSSKIVPGNNFRMNVIVIVKAAPGASVTEVDGTCLAKIDGAQQEYPAYVHAEGATWRLEFSVPRNPDYYVEAYALYPASDEAIAKAKKSKTKPKKTKSDKLLVQLRL